MCLLWDALLPGTVGRTVGTEGMSLQKCEAGPNLNNVTYSVKRRKRKYLFLHSTFYYVQFMVKCPAGQFIKKNAFLKDGVACYQ